MIRTISGGPLGRTISRALACVGFAFVACALGGCHRGILRGHDCNKPQPYASAQSIPPLRVPPGIDAPDTHAALRIPALDEPAAPPRKLRDPCLDEPPPYILPGQSPGRRTPGA